MKGKSDGSTAEFESEMVHILMREGYSEDAAKIIACERMLSGEYSSLRTKYAYIGWQMARGEK
jgi:hypothetical protein